MSLAASAARCNNLSPIEDSQGRGSNRLATRRLLMTSWNPPIDIVGDLVVVKVSASDVSSDHKCGRFMALKVHPKVKASNWSRTFSSTNIFPLGNLIDLISAAHRAADISTYSKQQQWLKEMLDKLKIHRLLRPYLELALENALDVHAEIEGEIGELDLLANWPAIGPVGVQLNAWAPLYLSKSGGVREIRRYRIGSAHDKPSDSDKVWAAVAAVVAAKFRPDLPASRVRVVEIGPVDASYVVLFDDKVDAVGAFYEKFAKKRARAIVTEDHVAPAGSCSECKIAGCCDALIPLSDFLGQSGPGLRTRSVSPSGLETYRQCPASWLLGPELKFPKEGESSPERRRGQAVHEWLEKAHNRGVGCNLSDLSDPELSATISRHATSEDDQVAVFSFIRNHVDQCPLRQSNATLVDAEKAVYGFDATADVIPVTKPDLMYMRGQQLVIREFKTTATLPSNGKDEAYSRHFQIPFMLTLLKDGLIAKYGAATGAVELEILTADASVLYTWETSHPMTATVAAHDVRHAASEWHHDDTWNTKPGPQCAWCQVRRWCPDRDVYTEIAFQVPAQGHDEGYKKIEDLPPF